MLKIQIDVVRSRLRAMNLSMDSFKQNVGVDRRTLERILSGKTKNPHPNTITQISEFLGTSHENIFPHLEVRNHGLIHYQDYSPFVVSSPVFHPQFFFGRTEIIDKLYGLWSSVPLQNAAIVAPSGCGKTSLFRYLTKVTDSDYVVTGSRRLQQRETLSSFSWIYLDLLNPRLNSPDTIYRAILDHLTDETFDLVNEDVFFDTISRLELNARYIIILDEIDVALKRSDMLSNTFWEGMRFLSHEKPKNISFLLGSKLSPFSYASSFGISSPFFNIFGYVTELNPLTEDDALEMFASSPIQFPDSECRWIIENSGLYPRQLQLLSWELLSALKSPHFCTSWREQACSKVSHLPKNGN